MKNSILILLGVTFLVSCEEKSTRIEEVELVEDIGLPTWPDRVPESLDFKAHVRPILVINCLECHNSEDASKYKGVNLQTEEAAMTSGENGPVIIPGKPDQSLLIQMLLKDPTHQWAMPPTPDRIWGVRLEILRRWIAEGAEWPDGLVLETPDKVEAW